jgi:predicted DNA-binding transcriptional regulator YafY
MQSSRTLEYGSNGSAHEQEFRSPSLRLPLARLLQLLMILQSERFPNARRLAEACAVSRRTIYRDLAILEAAGIAVLYHPERQGYQLDRDYWLQPTRLEDKEALSLLIMSRIGCARIPVGLLRHARSGLVKVVQGLPGELRSRITNCSELIADDAQALDLGPERQAIHETILSALSQRRRLSLWYRTDGLSPVVATKLSLFRLAWIRGQWCLVGHSSADREIRVFQIPCIERLELTDEPYLIPPRFRLERFLAKPSRRGNEQSHDIQLRFAASVALTLRDTPGPPGQKILPGPDGTIELFFKVELLDDVVLWIIGFGDQVEVIEPDRLRLAVRAQAERIAHIHSR